MWFTSIVRNLGLTALGLWPVMASASLVHNWDLNGAAGTADQAGTANLTSGGGSGISNASDRFGNSSSAISLNGTSGSWFSTTASPTVTDSAFTFSAWVRSESTARFLRIVEGNSFLSGAILSHDEDPSDAYMFVVDAANGADFSNDPHASRTQSTWTLVTGTWDGSMSRLYLNGNAPVTGTPDGTSPLIAGQSFFIGANNANGDRWIGGLDDVAIWNGALSSTYVTAHYNVSASTTLQYGALEADALFSLFEAGSGSAVIGGHEWQYATGLGGNPGDLEDAGGNQYNLVLDGSGNGLTAVIPEPATFLLLLAGLPALLARMRAAGSRR